MTPIIGALVGWQSRGVEGLGRIVAVDSHVVVAVVTIDDDAEQPTDETRRIPPRNIWHVPTPEQLASAVTAMKMRSLARKKLENEPNRPYVPGIRNPPRGWVQFAIR